jgi:hypothetical protein
MMVKISPILFILVACVFVPTTVNAVRLRYNVEWILMWNRFHDVNLMLWFRL